MLTIKKQGAGKNVLIALSGSIPEMEAFATKLYNCKAIDVPFEEFTQDNPWSGEYKVWAEQRRLVNGLAVWHEIQLLNKTSNEVRQLIPAPLRVSFKREPGGALLALAKELAYLEVDMWEKSTDLRL